MKRATLVGVGLGLLALVVVSALGDIGPPLPPGSPPVQRNGAITQVSFERTAGPVVTLQHVGINGDKARKYTFTGVNASDWSETAMLLSWSAAWAPDVNPILAADKLKATWTAETDLIMTNSSSMKFDQLVKKTMGTKTFWCVIYKENSVTTREIRFIVDATHPQAHSDARVVANLIKTAWPAASKAHIKTTDPGKTQFEFTFDLPAGQNQ